MLIVIVSLRSVTVSDMKLAHAFMCVVVVSWCVCVHGVGCFFVANALDETSIPVVVHFLMKNIYQSYDRGRAVRWSNVGVSQ